MYKFQFSGPYDNEADLMKRKSQQEAQNSTLRCFALRMRSLILLQVFFLHNHSVFISHGWDLIAYNDWTPRFWPDNHEFGINNSQNMQFAQFMTSTRALM